MKRGILIVCIAAIVGMVAKTQDGEWHTSQYSETDSKITTLKSYSTTGDYHTYDVLYSTYITGTAVGIGKEIEEGSNYLLGVTGTIGASRIEVKAEKWADDVFEEDYDLMSVKEVESFIEENNHLPGVPSEEEVMEDNIDLGAMDATLLRKIEELTLYVIDQQKLIEQQAQHIEKQEQRLSELEQLVK